ncbi:MAG: hypothetical protein DMG69_03600 [Acidobacteria bacterium]|nr:MAG: hypothetical protein DMG69_03600 [Acidobacteriota bacterium]
MSDIEQTAQSCLGNVESVVVRAKGLAMISETNVTLRPIQDMSFGLGDAPQAPRRHSAYEEEASSRMDDEGCPNESPSVDDATGYSQEEEDALEKEALSEEGEAVSGR